MKTCDHKSVGILVWGDGKLLMIERKKYNFGFAIPAGHQDGDDPETTAKKELSEEIGLIATALQEKLKISLPNPCKRTGGTYHDWTVTEAAEWVGNIKPSEDETKGYLWATKTDILQFAQNLEEFAKKKGAPITIEHLPEIVRATNEDAAWQEKPGLEPPMYFIFKKLGII